MSGPGRPRSKCATAGCNILVEGSEGICDGCNKLRRLAGATPCTCTHAPEQHAPANSRFAGWAGCGVLTPTSGSGHCECKASQLDMAHAEIARLRVLNRTVADDVLAKITDMLKDAGDRQERLATAVAELCALVRLADTLAGDDERWATWVAQARAGLKALGL